MKFLRMLALNIISWIIKRLYDFLLLLKLYVLVLEREATRSGAGAIDAAQERIDNGAAWIDFCDSLKGLADYIVSPPAPAAASREAGEAAASSSALAAGGGQAVPPLDSLDRREGLRYLTRVLRGGLEAFMDCWDPAWPVLRPLPYNVKLGADNPDNLYMYGTVSGAYEYRVYGNRGSVTYLSFGVYSGSRPGQGSTRPSHLDSSQLVTQSDGGFEIFLTAEPRGANWMPLAADASRIVVRQTFLDRSGETAAEVNIERLGAAPAGGPRAAPGASGAASGSLVDAGGREVKAPVSAGQVTAGLAGAAVFVAGSVRQFQIWSRSFASRPNSLHTMDHDAYMTAWADPAIHFFHGYWRLQPGEALVIQVTPPACPYWNFQLDNWWMESLDYVAHPETTTNKATASYMPDGSICLVVAPTDPRMDSASVQAAATAAASADGPHTAAGATKERVSLGGDGGPSQGAGMAAMLAGEVLAGVTWISTAHHTHGTMGLRWVLAQEHPVPRCRVVRLGRPLAEAIVEGVGRKLKGA